MDMWETVTWGRSQDPLAARWMSVGCKYRETYHDTEDLAIGIPHGLS